MCEISKKEQTFYFIRDTSKALLSDYEKGSFIPGDSEEGRDLGKILNGKKRR